MRGSLTFRVLPTREIEVKSDLHEVSESDLVLISVCLTQQISKLLTVILTKRAEEANSRRIIQDAADFKSKVDGSE